MYINFCLHQHTFFHQHISPTSLQSLYTHSTLCGTPIYMSLFKWINHNNRRRSIFWSSKNYEGVSHFEHMHSLLVKFEEMEADQKRNFEPYSITWSWRLRKLAFDSPTFVRTGSKAKTRRDSKWTKSGITSRDHEFRKEIQVHLGGSKPFD